MSAKMNKKNKSLATGFRNRLSASYYAETSEDRSQSYEKPGNSKQIAKIWIRGRRTKKSPPRTFATLRKLKGKNAVSLRDGF